MTATSRPFVAIGEVLWDLLPAGPQLGGAPANFAFHAAQLGHEAILLSAVGDDALGQQTRQQLEQRGIDARLQTSPFPTGTVGVSLDDRGVPAYDIRRPVAWDHLHTDEPMLQLARRAGVVCFGTLARRSADTDRCVADVLAAADPDCLRFCDLNLRAPFFSDDLIRQCVTGCNALKLNTDEADLVRRLLGKTPEQLMADTGLRYLILTRGEDGSSVWSRTAESHRPTPHVEVADTVGAGDAFSGAFCAALESGMSLADAHSLAVEVAAYVCTQSGAMVPWPDSLRRPAR